MSEHADRLKEEAKSLTPFSASEARGLRKGVHLGQRLLDAAEAAAAMEICNAILVEVPDHFPALKLLVDISVELEDFDTALIALDRCEDQFRSRQNYLKKKLKILKRARRPIRALDIAGELHDLEPNNTSILLQMGRLCLETGRLSAAKSSFLQVLSQDTRSVPGWLGRIEVARREGDLMAAAKLAETAFSQRPENPEIAEKTARAYAAVGRLEDAKDITERAMRGEHAQQSDMLLAHALVLRKLGDFTSSEAIYRGILIRDPENTAAWASHIAATLERGNIDEALHSCSDALKRFPGSPGLTKLQADVLRRAGSKDKSVAALASLQRLYPENTKVSVAYANLLREMGRFDEADALYAKILEQEPENWPAIQGRVAVAEHHGEFESAMQMLEQSMSQESSDVA